MAHTCPTSQASFWRGHRGSLTHPSPHRGTAGAQGGHKQPCRAWGRDFLLPSSRNQQAGPYLRSGSCQQPGDPAILHNLHLRQAAPARSRQLKVTQDASSCLNYSAAALPRLVGGGKNKTHPSLLPEELASPSSQNNEVSSVRAPACAATSSSRDREGGTRQRHTKPELKGSLSSLLQMGRQLRCRRAAGIIGAGGQQLSRGSPVSAQGITLFRFIAGLLCRFKCPRMISLSLRNADLGESAPRYSLFLFSLLPARRSKALRDDEKRKFSPAFLSCL